MISSSANLSCNFLESSRPQQQLQQQYTIAYPPLLPPSSLPFQFDGVAIPNCDNSKVLARLPSTALSTPSLQTCANNLLAPPQTVTFPIQQLLARYKASVDALALSINQRFKETNALPLPAASQTHTQQSPQQPQPHPSRFHAHIPSSSDDAVSLNESNRIALHIKELADKGKEFQQRLIVSHSQLLELQNFLQFLVLYGTAFLNRRLYVNANITKPPFASSENLSHTYVAHPAPTSTLAPAPAVVVASSHVPAGKFPFTASFPLPTPSYIPFAFEPVLLSPLEDLRCYALRLENQGRHSDALSYWKIACDHGDGYALYRLGNRYWWAWGCKYDEMRARELWLRSAEAGHISGLARCYFFGLGKFRKDEERAFQLYLTLAEQGDQDSINQVGAYYEVVSNGIQKDEKKAADYYSLAAGRSHSVAQYNLANCYMHGRGVDHDENKAVYYYHICGESGIVKAQCALGAIYEEGILVRKDREEALKWYHRAAAVGYFEAVKKVEILTAEMKNPAKHI